MSLIHGKIEERMFYKKPINPLVANLLTTPPLLLIVKMAQIIWQILAIILGILLFA